MVVVWVVVGCEDNKHKVPLKNKYGSYKIYFMLLCDYFKRGTVIQVTMVKSAGSGRVNAQQQWIPNKTIK